MVTCAIDLRIETYHFRFHLVRRVRPACLSARVWSCGTARHGSCGFTSASAANGLVRCSRLLCSGPYPISDVAQRFKHLSRR